MLFFNVFSNVKTLKTNIYTSVSSSFEKEFPDATQVTWKKENTRYEAFFIIDGFKQSAVFNKQGKLLEKEMKIVKELLPAKINSYLAVNYGGQKIKHAAKITDDQGDIVYETTIKNTNIVFDSEGNFMTQNKE